MHAIPLGVLVSSGADPMLDPPCVTPFSSLPELLHRHHPSELTQSNVITALALETARTGVPRPTACLASAYLDGELLLFAAAGAARSAVAVSRCPAFSSAAAPLESTAAERCVVATAQTSGALLQLALNSKALPGWERSLWHSDLPILAARSDHIIDFLQLRQASCSPAPHPAHPQQPSWRLKSLGKTATLDLNGRSTSDLAWCRHMPQRAAVLCRDGALYDVSLEPGRGGVAVQLGWHPNAKESIGLSLRSKDYSLAADNGGFLPSPRCAFGTVHPRHVLVALEKQLAWVDLRNGGRGRATELWACLPGQRISAVAAPPPHAGVNEHYAAAAGSTHVLLFDLRRPKTPLASWRHGMAPNSPKPTTVAALHAAMPDDLIWMPCFSQQGPETAPVGSAAAAGTSSQHWSSSFSVGLGEREGVGRLLAVNVGEARGVVCEWRERRERGGIAVYEGALRECSSDEGGAGELAGDVAFAWEPICWTSVDAIEPPLLLFGAAESHPPSFFAAMEKARRLQQRRALSSELKEGLYGESSSRPVVFMPSEESKEERRLSVGVAVAYEDWRDTAAAGEPQQRGEKNALFPVVALLSPTQEIALAAIRSGSRRGEEGGSTAAAAVPVLIAEAAGPQGGGAAMEVDEPAKQRSGVQEEGSAAVKLREPLSVALPLHKWLLEEYLSQYRSAQSDTSAALPDDASLQRAVHRALQGPITAWEAWRFVSSPPAAEKGPAAGETSKKGRGMGGSGRAGKGKGKQQASGSEIEAAQPSAVFEPSDALRAELRRGHMLPLPPGIRPVPTPSIPAPDLAQQARAAGWVAAPLLPPPTFPSALENAAKNSSSAELTSVYHPSYPPAPQGGVSYAVSTLQGHIAGSRGGAAAAAAATAAEDAGAVAGATVVFRVGDTSVPVVEKLARGEGASSEMETLKSSGMVPRGYLTEADYRGCAGAEERTPTSSELVPHLNQRREHLRNLLLQQRSLINEIQRSAKDLSHGQDEYLASQVERLRQAAAEVIKATSPDASPALGEASPCHHSDAPSPHSSNDDVLCLHRLASVCDITRPASHSLQHPIPHVSSSGALPSSSLSCDELLSMLDSVTNPAQVAVEPSPSLQHHYSHQQQRSPNSQQRLKRHSTAIDLEATLERTLPPAARALARNDSSPHSVSGAAATTNQLPLPTPPAVTLAAAATPASPFLALQQPAAPLPAPPLPPPATQYNSGATASQQQYNEMNRQQVGPAAPHAHAQQAQQPFGVEFWAAPAGMGRALHMAGPSLPPFSPGVNALYGHHEQQQQYSNYPAAAAPAPQAEAAAAPAPSAYQQPAAPAAPAPAAAVPEPSVLSSLGPAREDEDLHHIHLSPEEFDAVLAAFDTPGLEEAQ